MSFGGSGFGNSPFGNPQGGAFGQSGGFGGAQPQAGAFGVGGAGAQQQRPGGFGSSVSPAGAFGQPAGGGFGALGGQTTNATPFGGGGGFGGAQSSSAFGSATTTTPFGGSGIGGAGGGFGGGGGFGSATQSPGSAQQGTRGVPYQVTQETDSLGSGYGGQTGKYVTITAMPAYRQKSVEELRFEDYKQGVKGNMGASPGGGSAFGGSGFGGSAASASAFGGSASPSPFGGSTPNAFGGMQSSTASAFGAATPSPSPFGSSFGGGGAFGAAKPAGAFGGGIGGAASAPAFGMQASAPGFGSAPAFGGAGAFGAAKPAGAFGGGIGFGAASAPASAPGFGMGFSSASIGIGAASSGMFGAASAGTSTFGAAFSSSPAGLGGMSAPGFGAASGGMFGAATPASAGMFGAASSAGGMFGAAPAAASSGMFGNLSTFGASQPALGGLSPLGATTSSFNFAPNAAGFQSSASLFSASASTFGGGLSTPGLATNPATPSLLGSGLSPLGTPGTTMPNAATPYGNLPQLPAPKVATPTPVPGTQGTPGELGKQNVSGIASASRTAHTMLSPRLITPRSAMRMRPRRSPGGSAASLTGGLTSPQQKATSRIESPRPSTPLEDSVIVARENPRKLFVRDPVVSPFSTNPLAASSPLALPSSHSSQVKASTRGKSGHINGAVSSPLNGSASKELKFLSPELIHAKSPSTPIMLSDLSVERKTLSLPSIQSREYYCQPPLDDLARWAKADPSYLEAVPNLCIGRKGFGELRYKEPVDLRNVVIDKVVQFGDKEIRVYMDDASAKPPPGEGLNKPAEITLFNVHKLEKGTEKIVRDKEKVEAFKKKLRMRAEAQGAEFISYSQSPSSRNSKGGEYTFAVKHFSAYDANFDESSDEEEEAGLQANVYSDNRNLVQAMAVDSKLDPSEIMMMQRDVPIIEVPETPATTASREKSLRHSWKRSPSPLVGYRKTVGRESSKGEALETSYDIYIKKMVNHCQVESFKTEKSCISDKTTLVTDAAAILGRSFRVGWGPNGKFAHSGFWSMSKGQNKQNASSIHVEKVASEQKKRTTSILSSPSLQQNDRMHKVCTKYLGVHMEHTTITGMQDIDQAQCHFISPSPTLPIQQLERKSVSVDEHSLEEVCKSYIEAVESLEDDDGIEKNYFLSIWKVIISTFLHIDATPDECNTIRRQKISEWLRSHSVWAVEKHLQSKFASDLEKVVLFLSKHDVSEATKQSLVLKDARLASLISMAGCHTYLKDDITQQLEVWKSNSMEDLIQKQRFYVYELLSGKLDNVLSQYAFDWRRALACIMWYEKSPLDSVEESIHSFLDFQKQGIVCDSFPMYKEFGMKACKQEATDTAFELLKFLDTKNGPELRRILSTSGYTTDALDYSLSWHILSVLEGLGVFDFQRSSIEDQEAILHVYFGHILQLDFLGVGPEWILYVALHIPDSPSHSFLRENIICDTLSRTVSHWINDQERIAFFKEKLGIPSKWISGAQAIWYKYHHFHELEFQAYLEAEAYPEAFEVFSEHLGPNMLLNEGSALSHAFVPFRLTGIKTKVEQLEAHVQSMHKGQQQELALYKLFASLLENGSKGESTEINFDEFFERFASNLQQDVPRTTKTKAIIAKMCTVYAETLRYVDVGKGNPFHRVSQHIRAAKLSHVTPEEAMVHVQDAASILSFF